MHTRGDPEPTSEPGIPAIEYARSPFRVTRRQWRTLVALTLLNTVLLGWFVIGPQSTHFIQSQWQRYQTRRAEKATMQRMLADQQTCLDYVMPAGLIIFEQRPEEAQKLVADGAAYEPVIIQCDFAASWPAPAIYSRRPVCWGRYEQAIADTGSIFGGLRPIWIESLVFLGRRTTPGGEPRLIAVGVKPSVSLVRRDSAPTVTKMVSSLHFVAYSFLPASSGHPPEPLDKLEFELKLPEAELSTVDGTTLLTTKTPAFVTLLAGQADANHLSRFTLPILINGTPDAIDGWANDEGALLKPRRGSLDTSNMSGGRKWSLPPPPTSQPGAG